MRYWVIAVSAVLLAGSLSACSNKKSAPPPASNEFSSPERVAVTGYIGDVMEPFISRDGGTLFFNNAGGANDKDVFYAAFVNATTFAFQGPISAINTTKVDGVPTMDDSGKFYYVSTANYNIVTGTYDTLYSGGWTGSTVTGITAVAGIADPTPGALNFDVEVSPDGKTLYTVDGRFSGNPFPDTASIVIAVDSGSGFVRSPVSATLLANINTGDLEYAAAISRDGLELFFTRLKLATSETGIYRAYRSDTNSPFGMPQVITAIEGFVEAPALSPDEKSLYYHRLNPATNQFELYRVTRANR